MVVAGSLDEEFEIINVFFFFFFFQLLFGYNLFWIAGEVRV